MNVIALVAPPSDPALASMAYGGMLGEGWTVRGYSSTTEVPDDVAAETEVIIPAAGITVDAALISRMPKLRLIQVPGHGFDHVDVTAAAQAGAAVATVASSGAEAHTVAEMAILLAGIASRRILQADAFVRGGDFGNLVMLQSGVFELAGKTLGIVGLGRIGREVAKRARAFDMNLVYFDAFRAPAEVEESFRLTFLSLDELLAQADIVTLHAPLTPETNGLIGERALSLMKQTAVLVNTARGPLVDAVALASALNAGRIRAAAIDVFDPEPPPKDHPLRNLENCIVSPHMAGVTAESVFRIIQAALQNVLRLARGEDPLDVVEPGSAH